MVAIAWSHSVTAQTKLIIGKVLDSATRFPLQNVSIIIKNSPHGGLTDSIGRFSIIAGKNARVISFSITGYHGQTRHLTDEPKQEFTILLSKSYTILGDVNVSAKRGKYRNKNNPAVDLIRLVIANKSINGPGAYPYSSFKEYDKTRVFTDGPWRKLTQNFALKKMQFFFDNADTTLVPGKSLNSIYLQEMISVNYYRKEPEAKKKLITATKNGQLREISLICGESMARFIFCIMI